MIGNLSATPKDAMITYPNLDSSLSFAEYITLSQQQIQERRPDLQMANPLAKTIITANSPFELIPNSQRASNGKFKYGALLLHGLLDSPFSMRDMGQHLQANGILCHGMLLPGHGITPKDLVSIKYQNWIDAAAYGIKNLQKEAEQIYLIGYSTGATLSVYHALKNPAIAGIILLAPAIRIKAPITYLLDWHYLMKRLRNHREWLFHCEEVDYAKYLSIPYNAIIQVSSLTDELFELGRKNKLRCPIFMAVSHEDETISSHSAIDFFSSIKNKKSRLLVYTSYDHRYPDHRIITRPVDYPDLHIKHFSHVCFPFTANNHHYGQDGDYMFAARKADSEDSVFGAYNNLEVRIFNLLYSFGLLKKRRRELTYNPDFKFMADQISEFIFTS